MCFARLGIWVTFWGLVSFAGMLDSARAADGVPIRDGLEFWFDAAQFPAADDGMVIESWPDSSGHERHASQPETAARPRLMRVGDRKVVRFDGVDDHLRVTGRERQINAATVFLVVAPRSNPGWFRGFLAANAAGQRDYQSGFTIDQGPAPTATFSEVNVEGRGFVGAQNLARPVGPFGQLRILEAVISPTQKEVTLTVDGQLQQKRRLEPEPLRIDELTLGARYYTNGSGPQQVTGWIDADFAEILVYNRELPTAETARIRDYLKSKHAELRESLSNASRAIEGVPLQSIADPPPVQMFVPGFEIYELPVRLPNCNNVRYRPDGTLVALAYNGDVHLLTDTDGDGLEDHSTLFWDNPGRVRSPIGMALTPPGYPRGSGLFVATKSECLLLTDTDGDNRADQEIVVANGWTESFHNVDALGVAVDPQDHSVYFGLGTANFADPYLRDKQGRAAYRLDGERAAILKVAPDFSRREVFCTGIRFPVALAFNREGDLFCTDQEGATWVPNGNPLDELLHLQRGRHYGFPPRHPRHLPDVIDEPSLYEYSPQHQSTCGLIFNEPVTKGGPTFGPASWAGDALVCGYSRGKLYRTKLVKTAGGYVADNRLLASLNQLTVDACVSPQGELVVAVHSGGPDWGSGPGGLGKLYKIRYEHRKAPQLVAAWAAGPNEVRIAFDRPLAADHLRGLLEKTRITYGAHVRAGDEFESLRPGYEVVAAQLAAPRQELAIHAVQVTPDRRTLILETDSHTQLVHYAVCLPGLGRPLPTTSSVAIPSKGETRSLQQHSRIDLSYTLHGVAVNTGTGWLPHLDWNLSQALLRGSAAHDSTLQPPPEGLRLRTQLDLSDMLRPVVQPGSKLDYDLPPETVTVRLESSIPFTLHTHDGETAAQQQNDVYRATAVYGPGIDELQPVEIAFPAGVQIGKGTLLTVAWHTAEDKRLRPLPLHRLILPWAKRQTSSPESGRRVVPELAGGSWARGRKVFFGDQALCSRCHSVGGEGGTIGADLSNLIHRDYASVLRDVVEPSYAINPDYVTHRVALTDGRVLTGTLRTDGDKLLVSDTEGKVVSVALDDVVESLPATKSIMPEGLPQRLGEDKLRDLLTFLLTKPPQMPADGPGDPPPLRTRAEVRAVLAGAPEPLREVRPLRVVLVAGPKDHGPGEHDYPAWQTTWQELLAAAENLEVTTAWEWPSKADLADADVLVFYQRGSWTPQRAKDIDAFLNRGGGLVYIHYAVDGGQDAPGFAQRIGLAWQGGRSKFRHGPLELGFETGEDHPIGRNFSRVKFVDESYWQLVGDPQRVRLLASAVEDGQPQPLFWTLEPSKGRVFVSIPGHYSWTFDDPLFRVLLLRGIAWTAREPVDRFNDLVTPGARIAD